MERRNWIVLCFGQKGQGKSYSIKRSLDRLGRHSPVYVWDPNREYAGESASDSIRDAIVFRSWETFLAEASKQAGHIGRVVLQLSRERFVAFCTFVHRCGGCTVVLDELHDYVGQGAPIENKRALQLLLTTSRHRRINVYAAAWRPTDLPPFVRHCADEIRAFQTIERNDLEWYRDCGCPEEFVINLTRLRGHASLSWVRGAVPRERTTNDAQADPPDRGRHPRDDGDREPRVGSRQHRQRLTRSSREGPSSEHRR